MIIKTTILIAMNNIINPKVLEDPPSKWRLSEINRIMIMSVNGSLSVWVMNPSTSKVQILPTTTL